MAAFRAAIVTPWIDHITASNGTNHPLLEDEYDILSWSDITGQPTENLNPNPNEYTIEVVAEEDVIAAIEKDVDYEVLWSQPAEDE